MLCTNRELESLRAARGQVCIRVSPLNAPPRPASLPRTLHICRLEFHNNYSVHDEVCSVQCMSCFRTKPCEPQWLCLAMGLLKDHMVNQGVEANAKQHTTGKLDRMRWSHAKSAEVKATNMGDTVYCMLLHARQDVSLHVQIQRRLLIPQVS